MLAGGETLVGGCRTRFEHPQMGIMGNIAMRKLSRLVSSLVPLVLIASLPAATLAHDGDDIQQGGLDELRLDAIAGEDSSQSARQLLANGLDDFANNRLALAEDAFRAARHKAQHTGRVEIEAAALTNLGNLMTRRGKLLEAERLFQTSLKLTKPRRKLWRLSANTLYNLGILYKERGELDRARRMYQRALATLNGREAPQLHTATLNNLGNIYLEQGKFRHAERVLKYSLKLAEEYGNERAAKQAAANLTRLFHDDYNVNGVTGLAWRRSITPTKRAAHNDLKRAF